MKIGQERVRSSAGRIGVANAVCRTTTTMRKDYRNEIRQKLGTKAWIRFDNGFSVRPCLLVDMSNSGVRLMIEDLRAR
jgi:hypothetical protein